jgi:hypothetical protein
METTATVADRIQDARVRGLITAAGETAESGLGAFDLLLEERPPSFAGGSEDRAALSMLRDVAAEFANRSLTVRQRRRASTVLIHGAARLQANLQGGLRVRRDGFFSATPGVRAAADEFAEAVLIAAIIDPEESKLPHYGALLGNVSCHDETDRALALLLVRRAAAVSWHQLLLLALFTVGERFSLRSADYNAERRVPAETVTALSEALELERQGLLLQTNGIVANIRDLIPAGLAPVGVGRSLVKRLGLYRITDEVLEAVATVLR